MRERPGGWMDQEQDFYPGDQGQHVNQSWFIILRLRVCGGHELIKSHKKSDTFQIIFYEDEREGIQKDRRTHPQTSLWAITGCHD